MKTSLDAVAFMIENLRPGDFTSGVRAALLDLEIPTEMKGYRCLLLAIQMRHADPDASLTKEIYPALARKMGYKDWERIEKQIRDAISAGRKNGNPDVWKMYFPGKKGPSNGKFISDLSEMLDLWMASVKALEEVKL